jgi:peroxiredoxin
LENYARDLEPELKVNYCKLVVVTVDEAEISRELRNRIGAEFPFLIDADRTFIEELDIVDYTDPKHSPIPIPYTFVLDRNREIYRIYDGWWFVGRPTVEELRMDLRAVMSRRPDYSYDRAWDESLEARNGAYGLGEMLIQKKQVDN